MIVWLTGLPCAGKTTIAEIVAGKLKAEFLDGDVLRAQEFSKGVGFSKEERDLHILRVGYLAAKLNTYNDVICSFVSPYAATRQKLPIDLLVHVKCPVEVCIERDVKGMYAKALTGEIPGFTGISAPFEEPVNPDLVLETDKTDIDFCVRTLIYAIINKKYGVQD
jgi:adenylyl-sulfate kinase